MANGISADYSHLDYSIYDLPTSSNYFSSERHDSSSDSDLPELVSQNDPRVIQYLEEKKKFQEFQAKEQRYLQMQETCLVYHEWLVENALSRQSIAEYKQYKNAVAKGETVPQKKLDRVLTKYPSCHGCYLPWCAECLPTRAVQSPNNIFSFQSMEEKLRSTLEEPIPTVEATSKWLCFVPTIETPVQGKRKARKKKPKSRR